MRYIVFTNGIKYGGLIHQTTLLHSCSDRRKTDVEQENNNFITLISIIALLTSCYSGGTFMGRSLSDTDAQKADTRFKQGVEAINMHDKSTVKSMFSKNALTKLDDFDGWVDRIFKLFQNKITSWNCPTGGPVVDESNYKGAKTKKLYHSIMLKQIINNIFFILQSIL